MPKLLITILLISLFGCSKGYRGFTPTDFEKQATAAQQEGNWQLASLYLGKIVSDTNVAYTPTYQRAAINYEYARSLGITCFFEASEKHFKIAFQLDKEYGGPIYTNLVELGRLNLDQGKWLEAISYFDQAFPELDNINASRNKPHAYAELLDEYAEALEGMGKSEARNYRKQAKDIRRVYPKKPSNFNRTRYGTHCNDQV